MRRVAAALALALLLPLAGCGDPEQRYCDDLQQHRKELADMIDSTSATALLSHLPTLEELAGKAPPDLVDEWQAFLQPIQGLESALRKAHVKASQFSDGKPPAGLSAADEKAIIEAADQLGSQDAVAGGAGIDQQARDVCKINLGL